MEQQGKVDKAIIDVENCLNSASTFNCGKCEYRETCDETSISVDLIQNALYAMRKLKEENERLVRKFADVTKEITERKAFNLKCTGKPPWLSKGIDIGFNTALDILKKASDSNEQYMT